MRLYLKNAVSWAFATLELGTLLNLARRGKSASASKQPLYDRLAQPRLNSVGEALRRNPLA